MNSLLDIQLFVVGLFVGILLFIEIGRRIGARWKTQHMAAGGGGWGAVEGSMFALLGLLIAFTFSGAAARFDARRQLIISEANALGTAYLRLDLLPADAQPKLRESFRKYLDLHFAITDPSASEEAVKAAIARVPALQHEIWSEAVAACSETGAPHTTMMLIPALNEAFDVATTRLVMGSVHQPQIILNMVALLALVCALLSGYDMSDGPRHSWIHTLCFAGILAATVYVILDLEHPRLGVIRLDVADQALVELRESMNTRK
jgi:hypothetical protein